MRVPNFYKFYFSPPTDNLGGADEVQPNQHSAAGKKNKDIPAAETQQNTGAKEIFMAHQSTPPGTIDLSKYFLPLQEVKKEFELERPGDEVFEFYYKLLNFKPSKTVDQVVSEIRSALDISSYKLDFSKSDCEIILTGEMGVKLSGILADSDSPRDQLEWAVRLCAYLPALKKELTETEFNIINQLVSPIGSIFPLPMLLRLQYGLQSDINLEPDSKKLMLEFIDNMLDVTIYFLGNRSDLENKLYPLASISPYLKPQISGLLSSFDERFSNGKDLFSSKNSCALISYVIDQIDQRKSQDGNIIALEKERLSEVANFRFRIRSTLDPKSNKERSEFWTDPLKGIVDRSQKKAYISFKPCHGQFSATKSELEQDLADGSSFRPEDRIEHTNAVKFQLELMQKLIDADLKEVYITPDSNLLNSDILNKIYGSEVLERRDTTLWNELVNNLNEFMNGSDHSSIANYLKDLGHLKGVQTASRNLIRFFGYVDDLKVKQKNNKSVQIKFAHFEINPSLIQLEDRKIFAVESDVGPPRKVEENLLLVHQHNSDGRELNVDLKKMGGLGLGLVVSEEQMKLAESNITGEFGTVGSELDSQFYIKTGTDKESIKNNPFLFRAVPDVVLSVVDNDSEKGETNLEPAYSDSLKPNLT